MADSMGQMVLLNGTSSSGKTSLARALQSALLPEIWLHIDVDLLRKSHPDPTFAAPAAVEKGIAMEKLLQAIPGCMAALLRQGNNLIVDDIFGPAQLRNYVETLYPEISPLFVGVRCDVAELDRREVARGNRPPGTARGLLRSVFAPGVFDLEVDTSCQSPQTAADLVVERLRDVEKPNAFSRLSELDLAQIVAEFEAR